jgi:glycine cleavage system H protein
MDVPAQLLYRPSHEWVRAEDRRVTIGITDFAQDELGMIVFVELPQVGDVLKAGDPLGSLESVKTVSEVLSPVSGKVTAINSLLEKTPSLLNESPFDQGWMVVMELEQLEELDVLWGADKYRDVFEYE